MCARACVVCARALYVQRSVSYIVMCGCGIAILVTVKEGQYDELMKISFKSRNST